MACIDDIRSKLTLVPPIAVSDNNRPNYQQLLEFVIKNSIREYSELVPLLKEKEITTSAGQTTLDIYNDIDENFMDFIIFDLKDNVYNGIFLPDIRTTINPIISGNMLSFIQIQGIYDYIDMLREYTNNKQLPMIFNGNTIKVEENTTYYILYEAYRTENDINISDCSKLTSMVELNIVGELLDSYLFNDEQPIRSVSISGISVTFNVETKETLRRLINEKKLELKEEIMNIYDFVGRW